jgi:hypothetical protein
MRRREYLGMNHLLGTGHYEHSRPPGKKGGTGIQAVRSVPTSIIAPLRKRAPIANKMLTISKHEFDIDEKCERARTGKFVANSFPARV